RSASTDRPRPSLAGHLPSGTCWKDSSPPKRHCSHFADSSPCGALAALRDHCTSGSAALGVGSSCCALMMHLPPPPISGRSPGNCLAVRSASAAGEAASLVSGHRSSGSSGALERWPGAAIATCLDNDLARRTVRALAHDWLLLGHSQPGLRSAEADRGSPACGRR